MTAPRVLALAALLLAAAPPAGAGPVRLPRTGQTTCYDAGGVIVDCAGTGQDGEVRAGEPWPDPRFTANGDGTVTDNLTGLVWLADADCTETAGGVARAAGLLDWPSALAWCNGLGGGRCGLRDGSAPGDWRLPNVNELKSLVDHSRHDPDLPAGHPFANVRAEWYWSSTSNPVYTAGAFTVGLSRGSVHVEDKVGAGLGSSRVADKAGSALGVWPVRDPAPRRGPAGPTVPSAP